MSTEKIKRGRGRPPRGLVATEAKRIRLQPATWLALEGKAKAQGVSVGAIVEQLVMRDTDNVHGIPALADTSASRMPSLGTVALGTVDSEADSYHEPIIEREPFED